LAAEKISPNSDSLGTAVEILGRIFVCSSMFHVGRAFIGIGSDFVIKKQCLNKAVDTIACVARGLCFFTQNSSTEILLKTLLKAQNPRFGRGFVQWRRPKQEHIHVHYFRVSQKIRCLALIQ